MINQDHKVISLQTCRAINNEISKYMRANNVTFFKHTGNYNIEGTSFSAIIDAGEFKVISVADKITDTTKEVEVIEWRLENVK